MNVVATRRQPERVPWNVLPLTVHGFGALKLLRLILRLCDVATKRFVRVAVLSELTSPSFTRFRTYRKGPSRNDVSVTTKP